MVEVQVKRLSGSEPIALNPGVAQPLSGRSWAADLTRLVAGDASVDLVSLEPHQYDSLPAGSRFPPAMLMVAVASGRVQGTAGDQDFEVLPGQALFVDTRLPLHSRVDQPVRLVRAVVDHHRLPSTVRLRPPAEAVVLVDSNIAHSCVAAATELVRRSEQTPVPDDESGIETLLVGMHRSLIAESLRQAADDGRLDLLLERRARMTAYIDAHLTDPDLSPATIGDAFDLAVRSVHGAFAGSGHTVADLIRRRRIETVQAILAGRVIMPQLTELVQLSGFHNPTHLVRAFQAVTGVPIRTWFDRQPDPPATE